MGVVGNSAAGFGHEQVMEFPRLGALVAFGCWDVDAFGLLFERHARAIYNFCFRRVALGGC